MNRKNFFGLVFGVSLLVFPTLAFADRDSELMVYVYVNNANYYCGNDSYDCDDYDSPSDFRIKVTGEDSSPSSFYGSKSGTRVWLDSGYYSVEPVNVSGWNQQLSGDCSGTINDDQSRSCTVTFSPTHFNNHYCGQYGYQNCYPYPDNPPVWRGTLTCTPAHQQVTLGSSATFTATGGNGFYSWGTSNQAFVGGAVFTWQATTPGPQSVVVSSGGQTAPCSVNVIGTGYS